jgi:hypothetical protein
MVSKFAYVPKFDKGTKETQIKKLAINKKNKWDVQVHTNMEKELYGHEVCTRPLEEIEKEYSPYYFFWMKPTKYYNKSDDFPKEITHENFATHNFDTKNPFYGWSKKHYLEFFIDVIVPKIASKYGLNFNKMTKEIKIIKHKAKWWKSIGTKNKIKPLVGKFIRTGKLPKKNDSKEIMKLVLNSELVELRLMIENHMDKKDLVENWQENAMNFMTDSTLQANEGYKYIKAITGFHNLDKSIHVFHLYLRLIEFFDLTLDRLIELENESFKNQLKKTGDAIFHYRMLMYLSFPPFQILQDYNFHYFFWFKRNPDLDQLTSNNFTFSSCLAFDGWTKKELLKFIDDLYTHVLYEDTLFSDSVINRLAKKESKQNLCQSIRLMIDGTAQDEIETFKGKFEQILQSEVNKKLGIIVETGDIASLNILDKNKKYKEILKNLGYTKHDVLMEIEIVKNSNKENDSEDSEFTQDTQDTNFVRYLDISNNTAWLNRFEETLNPQPSERTEIAHNNYIIGLDKSMKIALSHYQQESSDLNALLRFDLNIKNKKGKMELISANMKRNHMNNLVKEVRKLRRVIRSAPILDKDIVVYRGDKFADRLSVGEYVYYNTFLSTSISIESATNFIKDCCILEMTIPKDSFIALLLYTMPFVEQYRQEFEVLLINSTKWVVASQGKRKIKDQNISIYKLKYINSDYVEREFTKYCVNSAKLNLDGRLDEIYNQCSTNIRPECNLVLSGLRLGYGIESQENIQDLCTKIQGKRNLVFSNSDFSKMSHEMCLDSTKYIKSKILGEGAAGKVYKACIEQCNDERCIVNNCVAIKQTPIWSDEEFEYRRDFTSEQAMKYQSWAEIVASTLVTKLIEQQICPNYVGMYHWYYCEAECPKCVHVITEVANYGTLAKWLKNTRSDKEVLVMAFQVFVALESMKRQFSMIHGDLHMENVLVRSSREERMTYVEYILDGYSYFIPNNGYEFLLADMGRAYIKDKIEIDHHVNVSKWYKKQMMTYNVSDMFDLDWTMFVRSIKNSQISETKESFLQLIKEQFSSAPQGYSTRTEVYNLDKTVQLPDELKKFSN